MYTFYFLYSSCGCSSKGLPAIWGLTVSVSTTLKVTLQPTSEVAWLSPWVCIHLQTIFSPPFLIPPPPPPFFNDYYFRTLSGRGGVFWCKRLLLWRRVGGPQQTSTKLGFLRLGKCEGGGGGANHNQALSVKMRNLCLFGLARPLDWVSQGYLRFYFLCTPYGITSWLFENSSTGLPAPECFQ